MGQIQTKIALSNPRKAELDPLEVEALVDTGVATLCIPEHVATQLNLEVLEQREITTAHGNKYKCDYVGPVQIRFGNRSCFSGALVLGDNVLLGAIPMDDMDLVIHPPDRKVSVNPESPNMPSAIVKRNTLLPMQVIWKRLSGKATPSLIPIIGSAETIVCYVSMNLNHQ